MALKKYIALVFLFVASVNCKQAYKICVAEQYLKACEEMLEVPTKSKAVLKCIPARDRMECLSYVQQRQADFVPVDPEDMYVASKIPNQDFVVFQEYRTDDEPDAEFRYEAVIVVHKDLPVNNLDQLKGLKSCHTGVNRNVGYKHRYSSHIQSSVLSRQMSHRQTEVNGLFQGAATKPEWFTNVLGLSEKIHHVADNIPIKPADYLKKANYTEVIERGHGPPEPVVRLCVTSNVALAKCRAMAVFAFSRDIRPQLDCIQEASEADCLKNVQDNGSDLASVDDSRVAAAAKKYNLHAVFHEVYGEKKKPNYAVAVVKRDSNIRKMEDLRGKSSDCFGRRLKSRSCSQEIQHPCMPRRKRLTTPLLSSSETPSATQESQPQPRNKYNQVNGDKKPNYAVAVVKRDSNIRKMEDLRGKRSCHNPYGSFSGLDAPLFYLINKKLINPDQCIKNLGDFFSGGVCLPGVDKAENNPRGDDVSNLKKQCSTDNSPVKCLEENRADVAFVSSADLPNFDKSKYLLVCLNTDAGGTSSFENFETCNIAMAPSRTWLSAKDFLSDVSIAHTPLSLAQLLADRTDLFNIYGEYLKNNNVIFNNAAKGLETTEKIDFEKFKAIHDVINNCGVA
ncbi:transferrin [Ostrinia nubilalis]|uniref:transferrin n=1 Tax=Ostrinia nubilalis TaxID=29057 RepID=UPI00308220E2